MVTPDEVERATSLFHRDGFVAVRGAIEPGNSNGFLNAAAEVIETLVAADPEGAVGGGAGGLPTATRSGPRQRPARCSTVPGGANCWTCPRPRRSSPRSSARRTTSSAAAGATSRSRERSSTRGCTRTTCGRSCTIPRRPHDARSARARHHQLPARGPSAGERPDPSDPGNPPVAGADPHLAGEPEWMRLSTVCPLPAGSAIFRDVRCWRRHPEPVREVARCPASVLRTVVPGRGRGASDVIASAGGRCHRTDSGSAGTSCAIATRRWSERGSAIRVRPNVGASGPRNWKYMGEEAAEQVHSPPERSESASFVMRVRRP